MKYIISFFDYTGHAVRDYARRGYTCICYDIQHPPNGIIEYVGDGEIHFLPADLSHDGDDWLKISERWRSLTVRMVFGFPPCTDLASSGAKHWAKKRMADPLFQHKAVTMARNVEVFAISVGAAYCIENPGGALSTLWRKPDFRFDPCDFGGYLPVDDQHPRWPQYIPPRDSYTKATYLWCGGGFVFPNRNPVRPEILEKVSKSGNVVRGSRQFMKLGGKSLKTKNIRNETPRGFALAVSSANP